MTDEESLEVTQIHSVAGMLPDKASLIRTRPFRSPHHNISVAGLIGGGAGWAHPGEISLAHHGAVFLDELPLYRLDVLESLRGPLEDGRVRIARSKGLVTYPCRFALVAAMNPCPCGYFDDDRRACHCRGIDILRYRSRLSGPLLDRFDMQVTMSRLTRKELVGAERGEASSRVRDRVEQARRAQIERYGSTTLTNASVSVPKLTNTCRLTDEAKRSLGDVIEQLGLSGRGANRMVRVARTIADLSDSGPVTDVHIADALAFRFREDERTEVCANTA